MLRVTLSYLALAASISAALISIDVGEDGALKFDPDTVTAAVGDTLEFHFYSGSGGHSVVSSNFSTPCEPATNAFFSGYIPGSDSGDATFVTTVNSTDSIWFYCSLGSHCQSGMVGVVNPPSGQSAADYAKAAQSASKASAPTALAGGVLTTITSSAASSSSTTNTVGRETSAETSTATSLASTPSAATNTVGRQSTGGTASPTSAVAGSNTNSREPSSTASSASAAATTSKSAGVGLREGSDTRAVLGLAVFAGGLVAVLG